MASSQERDAQLTVAGQCSTLDAVCVDIALWKRGSTLSLQSFGLVWTDDDRLIFCASSQPGSDFRSFRRCRGF